MNSKIFVKDNEFKKDIYFEEELRGFDMKFYTTWGLFGPKSIDVGSELLINSLDIAVDDASLDLGCGYVPIGLTIAKLSPKGQVHMIDKDYVAADYAKRNMFLNKVKNGNIYLSNAFDRVPPIRFNNIVSNLPAKVNKELYWIIFAAAKEHLRPGGKIYVATRECLEIIEFVTEAKTAKSPGREQFALVLEKIEKGEAQGIVSWHPDRLARNSIDGGKIIYLLDTGKLLDLKFPSFWFESTPQGKFMLSIAFGQSKYYVDNLSENVKRGNRQKLRRGELPGKAPYGYINNRQTRNIDVDPEISRIVKRTFEFFAEGGHSFTEVSKYMAKFAMTRANGRPLHLNQIRRTFTNKFYVGIIKYAGEYYEGTHKTFISKELFEKVQRMEIHKHLFITVALKNLILAHKNMFLKINLLNN